MGGILRELHRTLYIWRISWHVRRGEHHDTASTRQWKQAQHLLDVVPPSTIRRQETTT